MSSGKIMRGRFQDRETNKALGVGAKTLAVVTALAMGIGMMATPAMAQSGIPSLSSFRPAAMSTDYNQVIKSVVNMVVMVAALLTFFYLVMGAIKWITSGGDKGKVEEARNQITAAVIGLLILAATWAIFQLILQIAFGGSDQIKIESFTGTTANDGAKAEEMK